MAGKSNIEWTEHTWNPIVGCSIVSPGCTNCYAMKMAARLEKIAGTCAKGADGVQHYYGTTKTVNGNAVWTGKLARAPDSILLAPLRRNKPTTYFVNSMGDLFHEDAPDEWIVKVLDVIRRTSWDGGSNCGKIGGQHTYQVLTKRAARMAAFMPRLRFDSQDDIGLHLSDDGKHPVILKNLWLGVSCERQQEADERIPLLLQTPAAIRFISAEPLLGPVDLRHISFTSGDPRHKQDALTGEALMYGTGINGNPDITVRLQTPKLPRLDWVIVGGESGPSARPMHPDWARSLRDQCASAGVPMFFKQWGTFAPADGLFGAMKLGKRSCAIDRAGKLPLGDPMTDAGCDEVLKSTLLGDYQFMSAVGKKAAGRLLDGKEHNEFPGSLPSALAATQNKPAQVQP